MAFANQFYLYELDYLSPPVAINIDIKPSMVYLVGQYNLNTVSIFPIAHLLYYIGKISSNVNVIDRTDCSSVRSTLREILFKAYIALNEHKMIKRRFSASLRDLVEQIISLIAYGNAPKLPADQAALFKEMFGQSKDGLSKQNTLEAKTLFYAISASGSQ